MFRNPVSVGLITLPLLLVIFSPNGSCKESRMKQDSNIVNQNKDTAEQQHKQLLGVWGGEGISVVVEGSTATVTFDCAHGSITEAMVPDNDGKFEVNGTFVREQGGPVRKDGNRQGSPAKYSGVVNGDTLTLGITLTQTNEQLGSFVLTRGKSGRIRRCL